MRAVMARGLAVAALLAALAACGGGDGGEDTGPGVPDTAETEEWATEEEDTDTHEEEGQGTVFLGSDTEEPSASAITLPRTEVGETATASVEIQGSSEGKLSQPLQNVRGEIEGVALGTGGQCDGQLPPCTATLEYAPPVPGPYFGEYVATLADGTEITGTIQGEAVGDTTETPEEPTSSLPAPTPSEPTDDPTDVLPEDETLP
jgi:hypothetical protein